jgi:2'-5' RNA ligase
MLRLFAGLALPDDLRSRLAVLQGGIDGARWVASENMHITLRFIGEVDEITAEEIDGALSRLTASPLNIALSGAGRFNSWNKPRAVWVGVEKTPDLMALQEKVDRAIINIGLPPEGRKYMPHVTLARMKNARAQHTQNWVAANDPFLAAPFVAREVVLYESRLGRAGAYYSPVAIYPLAG